MTNTIFTSRDLNHDVGRAKKAARNGPVIITDRGKPSHVLMTYAEYERLSGRRRNLVESLSTPGLADIELDAERMKISSRDADLS